MSYLSASEVMIHYEEALYQVYAPLPFTSLMNDQRLVSKMEGKPKFSRRLKQFDGMT